MLDGVYHTISHIGGFLFALVIGVSLVVIFADYATWAVVRVRRWWMKHV